MQYEKQSKKSKKRRRVQLDSFVEENIQVPETEDVVETEIPQVVNIKERLFDFDFQMPLENEEEYICSDQDEEENVDQEYADEEISVLQESVVEALNDIVPDVLETQEESTSKDNSSEPLYDGCSQKLGSILLIICSLSIRFKLSDEALNHVINLLSLVVPPANIMIKSVYALKDYLKKFVSFPTVHYVCSWCGTHVAKEDKVCKNNHCLKDLTQLGATGYFIQHSIIDQLALMCKRESWLKKIQTHRFFHYNNNKEKNIRDIYDGTNYKTAFYGGFLDSPNSLSFSFNTDGVQIFKSSTLSMWPVYMLVNELPPTERKLKENIIYYGLWIGSKKPQMWSYLKPMHQEMTKLEDGVHMSDKYGNDIIMKATLLNCVCDLPARCMVSNSMQFNGKYGCWFCHQPGQTYTTQKGGHVHIYPFQEDNPKGPSRTAENLQEDVNNVLKNIHERKSDFVVRGIKGPFWFMFMNQFNVIHGFVVDYMHGICAGVMKMLLTLWFDKQHKNEKFSFITSKALVSERLKSIQPNLQITRPPRSLDDVSHWKTAEFRNFLFLWSLPILDDILPKDYYLHFSLLVRGIYTLSKEDISETELLNAEKCLIKFVENVQILYSERFMSKNIHQLLHITDSVRANGPLFSNNCFVFEDLNGYILKNIHGPTGVEMQIINAITKMQAIPTLKEKFIAEGSVEESLVENILRPNFLHNNICIEDGIYLLGQTCPKTLTRNEYLAVCKLVSTSPPEVTEYRRIYMTKLSGAVYAASYERLQKRNQSTVKFSDANGSIQFGTVKTFVQVIDTFTKETVNVALVVPLCFSNGVSYSSQKPCHKVLIVHEADIPVVAIQIDKILRVCNLLKIGNSRFVTEFPNKYEKD